MILFFLFCRPLLVVLFETTPRLTLFNFFEWQVLGYLAAIPEGGGVLGKKAMATLTHMSTGGRLYENAVLHAINRCVTTQLFLFDRPSTAVGAEPEDEEEPTLAAARAHALAEAARVECSKAVAASALAQQRVDLLHAEIEELIGSL